MNPLSEEIMELLKQHPQQDPMLALVCCQVAIVQDRYSEVTDQLRCWGELVMKSQDAATKFIVTQGSTLH